MYSCNLVECYTVQRNLSFIFTSSPVEFEYRLQKQVVCADILLTMSYVYFVLGDILLVLIKQFPHTLLSTDLVIRLIISYH